MKRRTVLASVGASAIATSAGCLDSLTEEKPTVRLGWFAARNADTEPHTFDLRAYRDGERVHHSSDEVSGRDGNRVSGFVADCTWGGARGTYTVAARVDGEEWIERDLTENLGDEVACVAANARYDENDALGIWISAGCDSVDRYEGGCSFAIE